MDLWRYARFAIVAFGFVFVAGSAGAQYPERPIRLIISSAVGGSPDIVTRILANELVKQMGQQIIIDNRPGAAQTIGTEMVVRATPDGYTIGYANVVTLAINKSLLPRQPYDPDKDLVLVGQFLSTYNLLARHELAAGEIGEGAHRLREAESRQAPQRVGRQRHDGPSRRRAVQDHDGHADRARAVQRQSAGHHRSHRGPGAADVRQSHVDLSARAIRQAARARREQPQALADIPRHSDDLRSRRAGLRDQRLGRHRGPGRHAAARSS